MNGVESLRSGLHEAFAASPLVHLLGEDVLDPYGGAFKVTKGLHETYRDRVRTTPISEGMIVGAGVGMALRGLRPVIEIMFGDFLTLAVDQLVNHAAKFDAMYGPDVTVPLVVRTPMGGGRGYGPTHSQSLEKLVLGVPHLVVVAPSAFHDAGRVLRRTVLEGSHPTVFIEHKLLYAAPVLSEGDAVLSVEQLDDDPLHPTVLVRNFERGAPDVTIACQGGASLLAAQVLRRLAPEEIRVEAWVPSRLDRVPVESLAAAIERSGRLVVVDEATPGFGWASEVAAAAYDAGWGSLAHPVARVVASDSVVPAAKALEEAMLPSVDRLEHSVLELI